MTTIPPAGSPTPTPDPEYRSLSISVHLGCPAQTHTESDCRCYVLAAAEAREARAENARLRQERNEAREQLAAIERWANGLCDHHAIPADVDSLTFRLGAIAGWMRDRIANLETAGVLKSEYAAKIRNLTAARDTAARCEEEAITRATAAERERDELLAALNRFRDVVDFSEATTHMDVAEIVMHHIRTQAGDLSLFRSESDLELNAALRDLAAAEERYRQLAGAVAKLADDTMLRAQWAAQSADPGDVADILAGVARRTLALLPDTPPAAATAPQTAPAEPKAVDLITGGHIRNADFHVPLEDEPSPAVPEQEREPESGVPRTADLTMREAAELLVESLHQQGWALVDPTAASRRQDALMVLYDAVGAAPWIEPADVAKAITETARKAHELQAERSRCTAPDEHYQYALDACTERGLAVGPAGPVGALVDALEASQRHRAGLARDYAEIQQRTERFEEELSRRMPSDLDGEESFEAIALAWVDSLTHDAAEARREAEQLRGEASQADGERAIVQAHAQTLVDDLAEERREHQATGSILTHIRDELDTIREAGEALAQRMHDADPLNRRADRVWARELRALLSPTPDTPEADRADPTG